MPSDGADAWLLRVPGITAGTAGSAQHVLAVAVQIVRVYAPWPVCKSEAVEEIGTLLFAFFLRKYSEWLKGSDRLTIGLQ